MRIGSLPPPRQLFAQLDCVGRFRTEYLHHDAWVAYADVQAERGRLATNRIDLEGVRADNVLQFGKTIAAQGAAHIAALYFEGSSRCVALRHLPLALWLFDPDAAVARTVSQFALGAVTPWRPTGVLMGAEWMVGRASGLGAPRTIFEHMQTAGLVGCVLEHLPMVVGDVLAGQQHPHLASACHWAACLGRLLLLPPRACLAVATGVHAAFWIGGGMIASAVAFGIFVVTLTLDRDSAPGIDPHAHGRPRATQRAMTDLRETYHRQDAARMHEDGVLLTEQLGPFVAQLERDGVLPRRTPDGLEWSQAVANATQHLQRMTFLLPYENNISIPAWDMAGFAWHLLGHGELEHASDRIDAHHARWVQKINFVTNIVQCANVCATRQEQHLLLPLQGFVGQFRIDDVAPRDRPDVGGFVQEQLSMFARPDGTQMEEEQASRQARAMLARATRLYGRHPQEMAQVIADLGEFLRLSYDNLKIVDIEAAAA